MTSVEVHLPSTLLCNPRAGSTLLAASSGSFPTDSPERIVYMPGASRSSQCRASCGSGMGVGVEARMSLTLVCTQFICILGCSGMRA